MYDRKYEQDINTEGFRFLEKYLESGCYKDRVTKILLIHSNLSKKVFDGYCMFVQQHNEDSTDHLFVSGLNKILPEVNDNYNRFFNVFLDKFPVSADYKLYISHLARYSYPLHFEALKVALLR
jgi:hypothetical protein